MKKINFELDKEKLALVEDIENENYISLKDSNPKEFKQERNRAKVAVKNRLSKLAKNRASIEELTNILEKVEDREPFEEDKI